MPNLTQLITRQSGLEFWYPLDNDTTGGGAAVIEDESGNNRDLVAVLPAVDKPDIVANVLNGRSAVVHDADTDYLAFTDVIAAGIRDIYAVAKVDDTPDFVDPYRGFLSDNTTFPLFVGVGSTTRWLSVAEGAPAMGYLYDDELQADGARIAPFDNFHRIRLSTSGAAVGIDGLNVGQDRIHVDRLFKGKWAEIMGWSTQRTVDEDRAIALYQDLKFNLWRTNGTLLNFPTPGMTGIPYRHFNARPKKWDDVTMTHEYDDKGRSFNRVTDTPAVEWSVEFDCYSGTHASAKLQYDIFDAFWDAVGIDRAFNFTDKYGTTHTNVRVKEYSRSHSAHKSWQNVVAFNLIKYP